MQGTLALKAVRTPARFILNMNRNTHHQQLIIYP